jgi:hypothetical protein
MNILSQTLNSFSTQISEGGVSLNTDIFEANLINLLILGGALFYLLGGALSDSLSERKEKILGAIQESEERLQEATARLAESETQLEQAQMVIDSIGKDAEVTVKRSISNLPSVRIVLFTCLAVTSASFPIESITICACSNCVSLSAKRAVASCNLSSDSWIAPRIFSLRSERLSDNAPPKR